MIEIILRGYLLLTVLSTFVVLFVILAAKSRRFERDAVHSAVANGEHSDVWDESVRSSRSTLRHFLLVALLALYMAAAFYFTGAGTLADAYTYALNLDEAQINPIPFSRPIDVVGYFENFILFIPLGFLLPLIWPNVGKLRYALASGLGFSLLIESSQLLNNRFTDIDDLIINTAGALMGFLFYKTVAFVAWGRKGQPRLPTYRRFEPLIYIATLYLGYFLLFHEYAVVRLFLFNSPTGMSAPPL